MWQKGALFAALITGSVVSTVPGMRIAHANDRRERDGPSTAEASDTLDGRTPQLLQRIGFRISQRQSHGAVAATPDVSDPAPAPVLDTDRSDMSTASAVSAAPSEERLPTDGMRPRHAPRRPRPIAPSGLDATVASGQPPMNPLRTTTPAATSRRTTLVLSDGGAVAEQTARPAEPAEGPAKIRLVDRPQVRAPERQIDVAADGRHTDERIPIFRIGASSRRTTRSRQNRLTIADGSAGEGPSGYATRNQKDIIAGFTAQAAKGMPANSLPSAVNPLRDTLRPETQLRPHFSQLQGLPSRFQPDQPLVTPSTTVLDTRPKTGRPSQTDCMIGHSMAKKPGLMARDTLLQPQSTTVNRSNSVPSPSERQTRKTAVARIVAFSHLGQPRLRREAYFPWATTVPTDNDRTSHRLPRATLRNRLPSMQSVAPVNTLRARPTVASASDEPQITAPKLLPRDEPQIEIKPLPTSSPSLRLAIRESRMIRSPENVVRVASANAEVCEVVQLNARDVAVVGKGRGTTRVELWYDKGGISRASHIVAVGPDQTTATLEEHRNQEVHKLISYLFPDSQVELISEEDRLIVRGRTSSRRQAIDILSTIRRSQLVPVVDELAVQDD